MGWTASLDMGSEKMVMALASGEGSVCHLKGIKIMASQGIEHGVIKDKWSENEPEESENA